MSVIFDNRRRQGDYEQGAPRRPAARDRQPRSAPFPASQRREDEDRGPLLGFAYERLEGVVHLTLAFTIVGGAAVILSSALFSPGAPLGGAVEKPAQIAQANLAPAIAAAVKEPAPVAPIEKAARAPAPAASTAPAPAAAPSAAPAADSFLDARPMSEVAAAPAPLATAPHPLAPPSADMREKLVAQEEAPPPPDAKAYRASAAPAPASAANVAPAAVEPKEEAPAPAVAEKPAAEPRAGATGARMAKCFLKLSGRVENSGACKVNHTGEAVIFNLPGRPLELAHDHGRVWTATLGGRNLGKVYKNKGAPCWGAKGFYACENG